MTPISTRRHFLRGTFAAGSAVSVAACSWPFSVRAPLDLILRGGTLIDGTGKPGQRADLGILGDTCVHIGSLDHATSARVIDVRGLVVAPGFIDVHAHSDLRRHPLAQSKVAQGVTLDVCGPDGGSPFPSKQTSAKDGVETLAAGCDSRSAWAAQHAKIAIDIGAYVGHGTVRQRVLGPVGRQATAVELRAMEDLVRAALEQGALGLSSGLEYFPGNATATSELIALCKVAAEFDRPYVTHIRNEDDQVLAAIDEAIEISRRSGASLLISHLKVGGKPNWHKLDAVLYRIESARAEGLEVRCDCYPYEAWSTSLSTNFPAWAKDGGQFVARLQDRAERARMRDTTEQSGAANGGWGGLMLGNGLAGADLSLLGKRLDAAASERGLEPFELACDLLTRGSVSILGFGISEDQMDRILTQPYCIVASDGSAVAATGRVGHPRSFGTFPKVLRRQVREQQLLGLEEAIRKMTALPAQALRLKNRGTLAVGMLANVVAFDPKVITDRATYLDPQRYAEGVQYLIVNGAVTVDAGRQTDALAGRVVSGRS